MEHQARPSLSQRFLTPTMSPHIHLLFPEGYTSAPESDYATAIDSSFNDIDFEPSLYQPDLAFELSLLSAYSAGHDQATPKSASWTLLPSLSIHRARSWNFITKLKSCLGLTSADSSSSTLSASRSPLSFLSDSDYSFLPVSMRVAISSGANSDNEDVENITQVLPKNSPRTTDETIKFDTYAHLLVYNSRSRIAPPSSVLTPVFASTSIKASTSYALECQNTWSRPIQTVKRTLSRTFSSREHLRQLSQSNIAPQNKSILKSKVNANFEKERELSLKVDDITLEEFLFLFEDHQNEMHGETVLLTSKAKTCFHPYQLENPYLQINSTYQ